MTTQTPPPRLWLEPPLSTSYFLLQSTLRTTRKVNTKATKGIKGNVPTEDDEHVGPEAKPGPGGG